MAFVKGVGGLIKKATLSNPTLYQAIRCMSSTKLFVGGLSFSTDENSLREAFGRYGNVTEARVISDRETGRSRGFGFVTFTSSEEAAAAITALDGQDLDGRNVRVNHAQDRPRPAFGGRYGQQGSYSQQGGYGQQGGYQQGGRGYGQVGGYGQSPGGYTASSGPDFGLGPDYDGNNPNATFGAKDLGGDDYGIGNKAGGHGDALGEGFQGWR